MLCHVTTTATCSALLAVAVANGIIAVRRRDKRPDDAAGPDPVIAGNLLSMIINIVAFLHYHRMLQLPKSADWSVVRYSDWLVTCPLLAAEIGLLLGLVPLRTSTETARIFCAAICSAGMVGVGLAARHRHDTMARIALWAVGCLLLAGVGASLLCFRRDEREQTREDRRLAGLFFLMLWIPYGLVFWIRRDATRNSMYNVLDFFSKVTLGMYMVRSALAGV